MVTNKHYPLIIKYFILLLILAFNKPLFATDYSEIGLPVTEVYDSFTHKGANQNWWLAQAENGLIYNGTGTGLNEWDGERWSMYKSPQKSRIRSISIGKDNNIYIGTTNDIGYYSANEKGVLSYYSLVSDWSFEEKQFGEIWSTAANKHGVMFMSKQYLMFWDGQSIQKILNVKGGRHRLFSINEVFYFKDNNEENLYSITFNPLLSIEKLNIALPKNAIIRKILLNKSNNLTIITAQHGIYELINNLPKQKLDLSQLPENTNIYNGIQAGDGYYYLTSLNNGLFIVSPEFKLLKNYTKKHGLGTNTILSVIEDFQGTIWLSGVPNIIKLIPPHIYSHYDTDSQINSTEGIVLLKDKVSVVGDSVLQLIKQKNKLTPAYFKNIHSSKMSTWDAVDYQNHLLYAGTGGVYAMQYTDDGQLVDHKNILKTAFAKGLAIDDVSNMLFITTEEGLFTALYENNKWRTRKVPNTTDDLHKIALNNGVAWVGTSTQELYRIENAQHDHIQTTIQKFIDKDGLGANNVMPFDISLGVVFGTNDGLMNYKKDRVPQLQFIPQLPEIFKSKGMDVYRLYEDNQGIIWYRIGERTGYATRNGDSQWTANEDLFHYFPDSGYKGFVKTDINTLWFSLANGGIFRANIRLTEKPPVTGKLNIRKITNLDSEQEIYGGIGSPYLPTLTQQTNSIRIQYALADNSIANATHANQVLYRHRLMGSSNERFSKWSAESHKDFTLLQGGNYQFEVEAKDAWGRITKQKLNYTVLPPWYLSTIAWLAYGLIAILLLIFSSWLTQKWKTKKLNLRNIELENEVQERTADVQAKATELQQQQELKDRFFTNVSHEFRTPLTLTIAPLEALISDNANLDKSLLHPIKTALRNSKKMLSLVGQVLDINRLESGRYPLHVAHYDLSNLVNNIGNRFSLLAEKHHQRIKMINSQNPHMLYFDQDQLEKCITNLVANAIKYSGEKTTITISILLQDQLTGIQVSDNGKGISSNFENKIFERFTQDEESEHITEPGTGIGLALVKELIELHHGEVILNNRPGKGCDFTLWLKNGHSHFNNSQLIEPIAKTTNINELNIPLQEPLNLINHNNSKDITTILVVDDNQELREFITSRLSSYYRILQASNGKEGYDIAQSSLPDLIISDVMMPIMNGLELTKNIKTNHITKTIPVILLTAKSSKRETVTGLQSGADDYLTKPFDTSELIVRANGLINNRKLIRQTIQNELSQQLTQLDKTSEFIDKLRSEILTQLSNPRLTVEIISSALSMSRHSLNRKCKNELDKTTGQLITETRMQHALSLLKLNKHSISEIAYGTGYDSLAYFSRTFKKHYGKTPTQIRQS